ncbi:hypothetical protein [Methanococcoides sp. FTZ1]|uniref:hypothetical protein n=1 Tax=Methanococcoides sp. FTZ1 TaxID=3439061 RepID=UPI003F829BC1
MKELKISISDELYKELSNVPDRDSFLAGLIEDGLKATAGETIAAETNDPGDNFEDLPEDAYFELEDTFEEEGSTVSEADDDATLSFDASLTDPDLGDGIPEPKLTSDAVSSPDENSNSPFKKMACFESIIFDLTDRVCDLEKQIIDMNSNIQFLKGRASLSDMADSKSGDHNTSAEQAGSLVTEISDGSVPYATLSFPELRIPPELLDDLEDASAGIEDHGAVETQIENGSPDVSGNDIEGAPFLIRSSKPLLFEAEALYSAPQNYLVVEHPVQTESTDPYVPDGSAPAADKLESCIFAYLPSGAEVKKDVIKSLLSKRYADPDVESKIDQLLSAGRISNIVKDDIVYLTRLPAK